jgi:purine-binding chemotaxis protein CheW
VALSKQFCTFFLGGYWFGVAIRNVQEVVDEHPLTSIPLAPPVVCGLMNLRGHIVTVIDLGRKLGLKDRPGGASGVNIVIRREQAEVSLLADAIGEVIEVPEQAIEHPPETLRGKVRELVSGVYQGEGDLLLILDITAALSLNEPRSE